MPAAIASEQNLIEELGISHTSKSVSCEIATDGHAAELAQPDSINVASSPSRRVLDFLDKRKVLYAEHPVDGGIIAWCQVVSCFFVFMNNFGLASSFGVYQAYYQEFMLSGTPASSIAIIGTLQASLICIIGVASGPLFDKGFFFIPMTMASIGLGLSFMLVSISTRYWHLVLCQGVLAGFCSGMLYIPSIAQIPCYFERHLGLALGMVLSGASIGGMAYPLVFRSLLLKGDFGWATRCIGFMSLGSLSISIILSKRTIMVNAPGKEFDASILKDKYFIGLLGCGFFVFAGLMVPYFDCATYHFAHFGQNLDSAFYSLLIINAGNFVGRLGLTAFTDYGLSNALGAEGLAMLCVTGLTILCYSWFGVKSEAEYNVFLVLWGIFSGGIMSTAALVLKLIIPRREIFATSCGILYALGALGILIGVPIANAAGEHGWAGVKGFTAAVMTVGFFCTIFTVWGARGRRLNPSRTF